MVVDELTSRNTHNTDDTSRWMAPELLLPEKFGFTGRLTKQLPNKSTDIYAIGMTILEVCTRPYTSKPLKTSSDRS